MSRADVNFRDKEARVTFDPAQVGVDQLIEAVTRAGFRASLKRNGAKRGGAPPGSSLSSLTVR